MSFVRSSVYLAAANFALLIGAYFVNVWAGRFLGPDEFGKYVTIIGLSGLMNALLTNGSSQAIAKVIAEDKRLAAPLTAELLKWSFPILIGLSIVFYYVIAPLLSIMLNDWQLLSNIRLLTPIIPIFGVGAIYAGYFIGKEQFGLQTVKLMLISIAKVLLTVILTMHFLVTGAIWALSLSGLVGIAFSLVFIRVNPFQKLVANLRHVVIRIVAFMAPMTAYLFLATLFAQLGVFITKTRLADNVLTGYFGAAKGIMQISFTTFAAAGLVLLTTVSRMWAGRHIEETRAALREIFKYIIILLTPAILFVSATSAQVMNTIYGPAYLNAVSLLFILNFGTGFLIVASFLAVVLNGIGKPGVTVVITVLMIAAHVGFALLLLPGYGVNGIAMSFVAASIFGLVVSLFYTYKHLGNFIDIKSLLKVVAAGLVVFFGLKAVTITGSVQLFAAWVVAGLVYFAVLFAIRELTAKDIRYIRNLVGRRQKPEAGGAGLESGNY